MSNNNNNNNNKQILINENKKLEILTNEYQLKINEININIKNTKKLLMKNCIHYANPNSILWSKIWDDASCPGCNYHITNRHLSNVWDEDLILSFL